MNRKNLATVFVTAMALSVTASAEKNDAPKLDSCGYPNGKAPALSSVRFEANELLQAFKADPVTGNITLWYSGRHALPLGVRKVTVKTQSGATTTDYTNSFTAFNSLTMSASSSGPLPVGTTALTGAQAGTDDAVWDHDYGFLDHGRPLWPSLFVTDITLNSASTAGDWQQSGISPIAPNAIYGTWKGATRAVDQTRTPAQIATTTDPNPAKNFWNGVPDTPPTGFGNNEGYGAELVWNANSVGLQPGHTYRLQFMLHDGDRDRSGGDAGEACTTIAIPGTVIGRQ